MRRNPSENLGAKHHMTPHSPVDQKKNTNLTNSTRDPEGPIPDVSGVDLLPGSQASLQLRVPR